MTKYESADELRVAIVDRLPILSDRLKQVGHYIIENENDFAIETLSEISDQSGIHPSTVVRFAKEFDFAGASKMQRLFKDKLVRNNLPNSYRERARRARRTRAKSIGKSGQLNVEYLLNEMIDANTHSLQALSETVDFKAVNACIKMIDKAETVYLVGYRRSFPVISYLAYVLGKSGKKASAVDGFSGLYNEQLGAATKKDILIATSFKPYASETIRACKLAKNQKMKVVLITDSEASELANSADRIIVVNDGEINGFRSLSSSMCLAQAIAVGYVLRAEFQQSMNV